MTDEADRMTLRLKRELIARGEYHGDETPRAPCMECVRKQLAIARAALVTAEGYARTAGREELAAAIEAAKNTVEGIKP